MTPEVYDKYTQDFNSYQRTKMMTFGGALVAAGALMKPKSVLGFLGTITFGIVGGFATLIISDLAQSAFVNFKNDHWHRKAPKLMNSKLISTEQFNKLFEEVKKWPTFAEFLKNEKLDEKQAAEFLYKFLRGGCCQGQSLAILSLLGEDPDASCQELLAKIDVGQVILDQLISRLMEFDRDFLQKFPLIIGSSMGIFNDQPIPASSPSSVLQNFVERVAEKASSDMIVAGEVGIASMEGFGAHVMTFQYSPNQYRFYDAENGFYAYSNPTELFKNLRDLIISKHCGVASKGFDVGVILKIYGIRKKTGVL